MAEALTQCWFTRIHLPTRYRYREEDGSVSSTCRYCHKPVVSWEKDAWSLDTGLNVSRLAQTASGRYLSLYDIAGDFIVHRYPIAHLHDEQAVEAFKDELRAQYRLDEADSTLELRDSARPRKQGRASARSGRAVPDVRRIA